ncbi:MAG: hypothetical protein ABIR62_07460 [Dokdonella sp.]|uniref:hypothetical protein n=1 Tax=Dokdonella sp. TaxID=2291710 RepID=UPI0032645B4E
MLAIMDSFNELDADSAQPASLEGPLEWRVRYNGLLAVAYIGGKAVAGVSGPWSDKFALTWWERPLPSRQLELFDTMADAKGEVEQWARRMHVGGYSKTRHLSIAGHGQPAQVQPVFDSASIQDDSPQPANGLFGRIRSLLPSFSRTRSGTTPSETIDRLRRNLVCSENDIGNLHFAANE